MSVRRAAGESTETRFRAGFLILKVYFMAFFNRFIDCCSAAIGMLALR